MSKRLDADNEDVNRVQSLVSETGQFYAAPLLTRVFKLEKSLEKERHLARTDALTGLPNRRALIEHLQRALQDELKFTPAYTPLPSEENRNLPEKERVGVAIAFIDLDGFKAINDTHGHEAGDEVLREVASFLTVKFRETDTFSLYKIPAEAKEMAGRLGGDEFLLVLRHTNADHLASRRAEIEADLNMLKIDFKKPDGKEVRIEIKGSLGLIDCNLDKTAEENLEAADKLMYERKQERKQQRYSAQITALKQIEDLLFTPNP